MSTDALNNFIRAINKQFTHRLRPKTRITLEAINSTSDLLSCLVVYEQNAMNLLYILLLAILSYPSLGKVSYRNYRVYKIIPKNAEAVEALKSLGDQATEHSLFQFWHEATKVGQEVSIMAAPAVQANIEHMLEDLEVESEVMIEDVQKGIDAENPWARTGGPNPVNWTVYNTLDEINNWLESLAVEFPEYITILKPGKSHLGRDIVGIKLDFNSSVSKQTVFMESNIHAREWITSAVNTYILNEFLRSNNSNVTQLAEKYTWYFFPVMNPDGFAFSHEEDRMWRKTRTRYNIICYGADPNRNWDYQWMVGGASQNPCSDIYAGPRAFSEPSVEVMRQFISSVASNMIAYIDFHSYLQLLLLPYGHTTEQLDNYQEMKEIGEIAMENLKSVHNTTYTVGNIAEAIYVATGSSMDWVKGTFKVPIAVTYELRDKGQYGFLLPADQIIHTGQETLISIVSIFEEYEKRNNVTHNVS